jgi:hypothetical protein
MFLKITFCQIKGAGTAKNMESAWNISTGWDLGILTTVGVIVRPAQSDITVSSSLLK